MIRAVPRYLAVGATCAILHNVIMIAGDFVGLHYVASTLVSFVIVVLCGYGLHSTFTFGRDLSLSSLWRYALGMAANLPGSLVLMFVLCSLAGIPVVVAAPATTVILFLWNFAVSRPGAIVREPRGAEGDLNGWTADCRRGRHLARGRHQDTRRTHSIVSLAPPDLSDGPAQEPAEDLAAD